MLKQHKARSFYAAMSTTTEAPVISLEGISKRYRSGDEQTIALHNINLTINKGEFIAIMGPSGSGKSTMMHILGLLDTPTDGSYQLDGRDVSKLKKNTQADLRNQHIGFVFQQFNLMPRTTVLENLLLPTVYGELPDRYERAEKLLKEVDLADRATHTGAQLSGGQIQRVAVARALMMNPALILADEPTGNLDSKRSEEIMQLFRSINKKGATIVLITHEPEIAAFADRVITLKDGKIIKDVRNK
ncbi:MAG TPA: ABC transporter ATP-binding protein [Candidatus Saccharimonadales bacterium]|nr:ABC transporter ATP-binding protein [Candidatus Saccharimonadales bacterium]